MDHPPKDASAEDIARFLEEDFWEQLAADGKKTGKGQSDDGPDNSDDGAKNE